MGLYSDYVFPKLYDYVVDHKFYDLNRSAALARARGKILEIGIGTGINLDYYPPSVKEITAVDPNAGMEKVMREKLSSRVSSGRNMTVQFHSASAENLPFQDASFDTVVSTLVMCSIPNLEAALNEIKRVLKPDGEFIFIEHGLSRDRKTAALQKMLDPIQRVVGCGCRLTVDAENALKQSGMKIKSIQLRYLAHSPKFIGHLYEGVATP